MRDYQKLKHHLQEKEEQLSRFHDYFNTNKFVQDKLKTDNNQLRQEIGQLANDCERLKLSQQQSDNTVAQLRNQMATESQIKKHVLTENQNLRDDLQMKESQVYQLNNTCSFQRQQYTTEIDRLKDQIHTLEQTVDRMKQKELLQVSLKIKHLL